MTPATLKLKNYIPIGFIILFGVLQDYSRDMNRSRDLVSSSDDPSKYAALYVNPEVIKRFLGLRIVAADLVWIDTLIKSDTKREGKSFTTFYQSAKMVSQLDPDNFLATYVFGLYLSVIKDDIPGATDILRAGAQRLNEAPVGISSAHWRIYFALGYNLIFEEHEFDEGSKWIQKAAEFKATPPYIKALAKRIATEEGRLEVGAKVLNDVHSRATRPEERERIEEKLLDVATQQELLVLNRQFNDYLKNTGFINVSNERVFRNFLKATAHSGKDLRGREFVVLKSGGIGLNPLRKIK